MPASSRGQNKSKGKVLTDIAGRQSFATIFGELITGEKIDDVSVQFQYNNNTSHDLVIDTPIGTGGQSNANSMMRVFAGAGGVGEQNVLSKDSIRYRPGNEAFAQYTARFVGARVGVKQFFGIGNGDNKVCFGTEDGVFGAWFQEGGNAPEFTPQSEFSNDKLDGKGDSGFEIDITKENILYPIYGWLGIAPVFWIVYGGANLGWIVAHIKDDVNTSQEPHLKNPTLPMVCNVTATSGTDIAFIETSSWRAGAVVGKKTNNSCTRRFGAFALNIDATQAATNDATHLVSLKSKATFLGKTNHVKSIIDFIISTNNVNKDVIFEAYSTQDLIGLNPTFDPVFVDVNASNSVMQAGKSQSAVAIDLDTAGLIPLDFAIVKKEDQRVNSKVKGFNVYPTNEITFVIVKPPGGTGEVSLQMDWDELF